LQDHRVESGGRSWTGIKRESRQLRGLGVSPSVQMCKSVAGDIRESTEAAGRGS
jgi:hypothetical protein